MSLIETAARNLAAKAENGPISDEDIKKVIDAVKLCDGDPDGKKARYRIAAWNQFHSEGDLEFDDNNVVSLGEDDEGAYVQCWKWIPLPEKDND